MLPITHPRPLPRVRHFYEFGVCYTLKRAESFPCCTQTISLHQCHLVLGKPWCSAGLGRRLHRYHVQRQICKVARKTASYFSSSNGHRNSGVSRSLMVRTSFLLCHMHVIGFYDLWDLWVIKMKKPVIICARSTPRSREQSTAAGRCEMFVYSIGKVTRFYYYQTWLINLFEKFTRCAKVCALFSWFRFSGADWLRKQTPITWIYWLQSTQSCLYHYGIVSLWK